MRTSTRNRIAAAVCAGALFGLLAVSAQAASPLTGRLLVTLDGKPSAHALRAVRDVAARLGASGRAVVVPQIGLVTVGAPAGGLLAPLAAALRALPGVASVQAERRAALRAPRVVPNDPALSTPETGPAVPAGTPVEWWAGAEGFPTAWNLTRGAGAKIAIVDTGIDGNHPEFAGRIGETADFDDIPTHGPPTGDEAGHGTHVASLACADADNAIGLAGGAPDCTLLVVKTDLSDSSVAASIVWAVDHGADAINASFGNDGSRAPADAVVRAVDYAYTHDVVLVAAAADSPVEEQGDPASVVQPAGSGQDITQGKGLSVTAATFAGGRAGFAGFGSEISLAAYGAFGEQGGPRGLFGAFPGNTTELETGSLLPDLQPPCGCRTTFNGDARYAYLQGTSMAAPQVTAAAALVAHLNPDLGAADIIRLLKETARRPAGTGWNPDLGWGILDAAAAVARARSIDRRPPTSRLRKPNTRSRPGRVILRWTGRDTAPPGLVASGVAGFELWRSAGGGPYRRIVTTRGRSFVMRARPGQRYAFFTIAVDAAGNREARPAKADARVRIPRR